MVLVVIAVVGAGVAFSLADRLPPLIVQGEVEATRVDLSPRVSGRVRTLRAEVGDRVHTGDTVIELDSPQLEASLAVAEASLAVAMADQDRVYSTRQEVIDAQKAGLGKAEADVELARRVYERQQQLLHSGNTTQQKMDEATNSLEAAQKALQSAQANLTLARQGNSDQEKSLAVAKSKQAQATVDQIKTDLAELVIRAPIAGQVTVRTAELGELFNPGEILISIVQLDDAWFTFNLREDLLAGLKVGDQFEVQVPALGNQSIPVRVTMINARGDYANWRATKATGDFDLRTFEVRARPVAAVEGLRPGMSGIVVWSSAAESGARR
jgi:HlyD family secretion protein